MQINSSYNQRSFGANYSEELWPIVDRLYDRVMRLNARQHAKLDRYQKNLKTSAKALLDGGYSDGKRTEFLKARKRFDNYREVVDNIKHQFRDALEKIELSFPEKNLYICRKNGKDFYAVKTKFKNHLLLPVKAIGNQDPKANPEAVKISLSDFSKIADRMYDSDTKGKVFQFIHEHFGKKL